MDEEIKEETTPQETNESQKELEELTLQKKKCKRKGNFI